MFKLNNNEVRIEPTNICNAHCVMCPREKMTRKQGIMDMDLYKKIVDQCVEAGAEKISLENFGEPFIDPTIFEKAEYAKNKNLKVLTISNGSLIDEIKKNKVIELFDVIRLSMYGMSKDTYEKVHRKLSFEKVKNNIDALIKTNEDKNNKCKILMYFLLLNENEHELNIFMNTYAKQVSGVSVWKPHNWSYGRDYRPLDIDHKQTCGRPKHGPLQVQWDGTASPCCFDFNNDMILGDFKTHSLEEIMRSEKYNQIRESHKQNNFIDFPVCNNCGQLNHNKDVLVYTNIKNVEVGRTNTIQSELKG